MDAPTLDARTALRTFCHTSRTTHTSDIYTISDKRCPELNGREIVAELRHGIDFVGWIDPDAGKFHACYQCQTPTRYRSERTGSPMCGACLS